MPFVYYFYVTASRFCFALWLCLPFTFILQAIPKPMTSQNLITMQKVNAALILMEYSGKIHKSEFDLSFFHELFQLLSLAVL